MASIKIPLLLILILCIAAPAFGADTVHTYDTVVHYDTTYLYDTTVAVQEQLNAIKSEFYDRAMQSIDDKRKTINKMLEIISVILIVISLVFAFMTYLMQRSRQAVDNEIKEIRERRLAIDKVYDEMMSKEERINKLMADVNKRAEKPVVAAEKEAQEKSITSPEEKIKLIEKADAEQSIDEYEKLLFAMELEGVSKDKLPTSLHKNVGLNYYRLGRYEKAVEELLLYLDAFPDDVQSVFNVAYCFGQLKNHDRAVHFCSRVTQLNPKHDVAYSYWAYSLWKLYKERKDVSLLEEAIDKCKKAVEINDKNDGAYNNWGAALYDLYHEHQDASLLEEAIDKHKKAVEINDKRDTPYSNWGAALSKLYDERKNVSLLEEAIAKCNKAIEINHDNHRAPYHLSNALLKKWHYTVEETGKSDETLLKDARGHALKALEIAPEHKDYNFNLACVESLLENRSEMLKALEIATKYDPKFKKMAREDKDFEKYRGDPDFIALTKED